MLLLLSTASCPDGGGGRSWRSLTCSLKLHILLAPSSGPFGTEGSSAAIRGWSGCAVKAGVHYGMVPTCQSELQTATCQPTASTEGQQWLLSPHLDVLRAASRLHPPHLSLLPLPCLRNKQACAYGLQGWSLSFLQPTGFQTSKQDSSSQYLDRRAGVPNMWFRPLTPKENPPPRDSPLPSSVSS